MRELGVDLRLLYLGLLAHKAPRILRVGHCVSQVIHQPGRSMLAGCQQSVAWARGLMHKLVKSLGYIIPNSVCYEHVDDLSQPVAFDGTEDDAVEHGVRLGLAVHTGVMELDLRISDKSLLLPSSSPVVKRIVKRLRTAGVRISAAASADDLGVQTAAGRRRVTSTMYKRISRGGRRAAGVRKICRVVQRAHVLGKTGVNPMQSYGHQGMGVSPTMLVPLRRNMKKATHLGDSKGCVATTIRWAHGDRCDPAVELRCQQVDAWMKLWRGADPEMRRRIRRFGMSSLPQLAKADDRWSRAKGTITGTICTLLEVGWIHAAPDRWRTRNGTMAMVGATSYADAVVLSEVRKQLEINVAREAEAHSHGQGIGDKISLGPARAAKRYFLNAGRFKEAAAVDYIVTGALQDPFPRADGNLRQEDMCNRCGGTKPATRLHLGWLCPDNRKCTDPLVQDTESLVKTAVTHWNDQRCLWARGLIPFDLVRPQPEPAWNSLRLWSIGDCGGTLERGGSLFTDGAGPVGKRHRPGAGVFSGVVALRCHDTMEGPVVDEFSIICGEVPGRQTVPRSEVWAAALAAAHCPPLTLVLALALTQVM